MTCSDPAPESRLAKPIIVQSSLTHPRQASGDTNAVGMYPLCQVSVCHVLVCTWRHQSVPGFIFCQAADTT